MRCSECRHGDKRAKILPDGSWRVKFVCGVDGSHLPAEHECHKPQSFSPTPTVTLTPRKRDPQKRMF